MSAARRWCVQRGLPQSPGFKGGGDNEAESLRFLLTALHAAVQDVGHGEPTEHRGGAGGAHADEVRHLRACVCAYALCDAPISNGMLSETTEAWPIGCAVAHATSNTRTARCRASRMWSALAIRVRSVVAANKIACHRVHHGPTAAQRMLSDRVPIVSRH